MVIHLSEVEYYSTEADVCRIVFLVIFWNEITTILTPSTSEGGKWGWSEVPDNKYAMLIYL